MNKISLLDAHYSWCVLESLLDFFHNKDVQEKATELCRFIYPNEDNNFILIPYIFGSSLVGSLRKSL